MKKIRMVTITIFLVLLITACSGQNDNDKGKNSESHDSQAMTAEENDKERTKLDITNRDYTISPYVVVGADVQVILKTDGTVFAKGLNVCGELGNGERIDSQEWVQVKNLENVVGIYAFSGFGREEAENSGESNFCYALDNNGNLYRWGANILEPEKMDDIPSIEKIEQPDKNLLILHCANGEKYLLEPFAYGDDSLISYSSLSDTETIYPTRLDIGEHDEYILIKNEGKEAEYIEINKDNSNIFEDAVVNRIPIDLQGEIITSVQNRYMYCFESNTVLEINSDAENVSDTIIPNKISADENIVKGFLYYPDDFYQNTGWTRYILYDNGEIQAQGDNEYGQLGDGTSMDYYNGMLTIDDAFFKDIYYNSKDGVFYGKYVVALDDEYNIWAWGDEYGYDPEIIINYTDFTDAGE